MTRFFEYKLEDLNNGPGLRLSIWLSGCPHNCPNCFEKDGQNPEYGEIIYEDGWETWFKTRLKDELCDGLSLLGGDPLAPCNYDFTLRMAKYTKSIGKTVYIWTGYRYENIPYELDKYVDCYIDGMYIDKLKCDDAGRGSSNQRFMKKHCVTGIQKDIDGEVEKLEYPVFYFREHENLYE